MPNGSGRSRAHRAEAASGETWPADRGLDQLAALIVNAARTRVRRRAMWRYQRAGYRPYVDHLADPGSE